MGKYSAPMADLLARIEYHGADIEGRLLRGFHWDISSKGGLAIPTMSIRGETDLPHLRLYLPEISESFRPARHTDGILTLSLMIATQRTLGVVAFVQQVEKVMDALQLTATTPAVPKALTGTLRHFDWKLQDNFILETSIQGQVSISAHPRVGDVGNRRS